jgi:hypothetical protein
MNLGILLLLTLLLLIIFLLTAPFSIEVDSNKRLLWFRFHYLVSARLVLKDSSAFLIVKIGPWEKKVDLLKAPKKQEKEAGEQEPSRVKEKKKSVSFSKMIRKGKAVLKSFRIRKWHIAFDSGNAAWNGKYYPWFYAVSVVIGKPIFLNFSGDNQVVLKIDNSIGRILWVYIRS